MGQVFDEMENTEPNIGRDGYINAKGEFVQKYTQKAKELYGDRY